MSNDAAPLEAAAPPQDRYPELLDLFVRMCETRSPSFEERAMADLVAAELRGAGLEVEEDTSGTETGSDAGNLLARIPGPDDAPAIVFCAHLDTVPLDAPVEVERSDGAFRNSREAILGADNKAAVAVFVELARRLASAGETPPVSVELLFTTCEEVALAGAKAFDTTRLRAKSGFVFDHATAIGELITAAPTYYRVGARFHGHAAHAGIRPEDGHNAIEAAARSLAAMDLGRHDEETTSNVGTIRGGTAANVVAERCELLLEARSLDPEKAAARVTAMVDALTEAAAEGGCDLETDVEELFRAYRLPASSPPVEAASAALRAQRIEPVVRATGGGSDAHVLSAVGIPSVNVANGTERNHEPTEAVSVWALETMLDVALGIVQASS
ncbi:MAG: M20/M25/M40 family metallo-hydrolase [Thermoleophilaceae bacterium]|nr:M20/M25/M40 family metallo-hydrolase [Thermoleophilaceae bacterium]